MANNKRNDIFLICGLIIIAGAMLLYMRVVRPHMNNKSGSDLTAEITVDNKVVFSENVTELELPYYFETETPDGGHNSFVIEKQSDGSVGISCTEADCPDKICVGTGTVTLPDDPIVCLPHKTTARLYNGSNKAK